MVYAKVPDWREISELSRLADLSNPPKQLFYQGTWNPKLFTRCVAIIGSRRMTDYGRRVIEKIIPKLIFEKKTIVSGFMYGVDQYAHEMAVTGGGKTIAVLGWGIDRKLEGKDKRLSEEIMKSGGLLISEWESQQGTLWTFPVRNRIVAALCEEVIVVEAGIKSGSLITANIANKLQRTLWAVPGPITSSVSAGTNDLIARGIANMWLGDKPQQVAIKTDDPILSVLLNESLSASELARKLGKSVSDIGAQLSLLALTGALQERGGKYYVGKN